MASRAHIEERLRDVRLFASCSKRELRQITKLTRPVDVSAGSVLASEGQMGAEFAVILSGSASVTRGGRELALLGAGQWFGEVALLDPSHLRTATVTAQTDMEIAVIDAPAFDELIDAHPRIARKILQGLAHLVAAERA